MSEFYWQSATPTTAKSFVNQAVLAGRDVDGVEIYVGRGQYKGDLIPGKVIPDRNKGCVSWGGREKELNHFEMYLKRPCSSQQAMQEHWVPSNNGNVPPGAVKVGYTSSGEALYTGRANHEGSLTPGKVHPSYGCLFIPFGHEEHRHDEYEVLVVQPSYAGLPMDMYNQVHVAPIQAQYKPEIQIGYIPPNQAGYASSNKGGTHVPIVSGYIPPSYAPPPSYVPPTAGVQMPALPIEALQEDVLTKMNLSEAPGSGEKIHKAYGWNTDFSPTSEANPNTSAPIAQWNHMPEMPANFYPHLPPFDQVQESVTTKQTAQPSNTVPHAAYIWQKLNNEIATSFVDRAVYAGREGDGTEIYVGRANYKGDVIPAKVIPKNKAAYVCYAGDEILVKEFEMYLRPISACSLKETWVPAADGSVPKGALQGGQTASGEALFVGRVQHEGTITPGKVQPSHRCLYVPYGSEEISFNKYEVLVIA